MRMFLKSSIRFAMMGIILTEKKRRKCKLDTFQGPRDLFLSGLVYLMVIFIQNQQNATGIETL